MRRKLLYWRFFAAAFLSGIFALLISALSWANDRAALVVALLSIAAFSWAIANMLTQYIFRPLDLVQRAAERFARGDLNKRLPRLDGSLFSGLNRSLNSMARQLDERMQELSQQRHELDVVLSSMVEGVISLDLNHAVKTINSAAGQLLNCNPQTSLGKSLQEVVRNLELLRFMKDALTTLQPLERRILFHAQEDRWLDAYARILRSSEQKPEGVLIVLNDVTRVRRLESMRRDFVANVSHELKTPVTSIKGFVETLLDGALENPEDARRFLGIVGRQADRLNAIFDDLLSLSRIEQSTEQESIVLAPGRLSTVLQAAIQTCEHKARERGIAIRLLCSSEIEGNINAPLLEQAVVNLIDNAIKFSEAGKFIDVAATLQNEKLQISVRDNGPGIERVHLPRLFERFYRVDAGRSRKQGGTGLGLAIVKHIAQVHNGSVEVESTLGKGSIFYITLPLKNQKIRAGSAAA